MNVLACVCCVPLCVCLCVCVCEFGLSLSQALDMLLAGDTVCGFSSWSCCSGRLRAVRATQTTSHLPPLSIISRSARSLLSLLSFSWAPEPGLWPVDECYILAVSTGVSWGLACGGSAVSGPVCQLLVPLPPAPQRTLQSVAQTRADRAATDSHLWLENERIALRIGIFIAMPMKRGCLKPLSARVLCF